MPNVLLHLYLAGALFAVFFIFFALGWLKAADVKFMTVLILWAGPTYGTRFILFLALFSAVFGVLLSALRYALLQHPEIADKPFASKVSRLARNGIVPYGLPIGLAALCVVPAIFMQGL
jgi:Flp pilus assembly protein protease CpaA